MVTLVDRVEELVVVGDAEEEDGAGLDSTDVKSKHN
jgi:hypothetical protein